MLVLLFLDVVPSRMVSGELSASWITYKSLWRKAFLSRESVTKVVMLHCFLTLWPVVRYKKSCLLLELPRKVPDGGRLAHIPRFGSDSWNTWVMCRDIPSTIRGKRSGDMPQNPRLCSVLSLQRSDNYPSSAAGVLESSLVVHIRYAHHLYSDPIERITYVKKRFNEITVTRSAVCITPTSK